MPRTAFDGLLNDIMFKSDIAIALVETKCASKSKGGISDHNQNWKMAVQSPINEEK